MSKPLRNSYSPTSKMASASGDMRIKCARCKFWSTQPQQILDQLEQGNIVMSTEEGDWIQCNKCLKTFHLECLPIKINKEAIQIFICCETPQRRRRKMMYPRRRPRRTRPSPLATSTPETSPSSGHHTSTLSSSSQSLVEDQEGPIATSSPRSPPEYPYFEKISSGTATSEEETAA